MSTIGVCADDFGLHEGINEAALALVAMGRAQAIGCLVGGRAWTAPWIRRLHGLAADRTEVGLHLDFTERPLLPGSRRTLVCLVAAALLRRLDREAIRSEVRAQLDAFEEGLGRGPAFVDGHQHVHQLPVVRDALLDELATRYRAGTVWLRSTRTAPAAGWAAIKPRGIEWLGSRALVSLANRAGFAHNHHLLGVYDFQGGAARYRWLLAGWLREAGDADLLMCHPSARRDPADPLSDARLAEYRVLGSEDFAALQAAARVRLAPLGRILADRPQSSGPR